MCRHSHDITGNELASSSSQQKHKKPPPTPADGRLHQWRGLLSSASQTSRPDYATVTRFFELGLQLMDADVDSSQEAIKKLASENGLAFIKSVTDSHVQDAIDDKTKVNLWKTQISPLFRLISHSRLVDSNLLEQEATDIYRFLVGVSASRMNRVFSLILDLGQVWDDEATNSSFMDILKCSLSVLRKAFGYKHDNIINEDFHKVVERFAGLLETSAKQETDPLMFQTLDDLNYLQRRLGIGKALPGPQKTEAPPLTHEAFVLKKDPPGHLSTDGPRHDNDHACITKIKIMPTYKEIMSPRDEYLPTTDSSQWHLPGILGRLDREFRLLREDTIGQLHDAVRDVLERIRGPGHEENSCYQNSARTSSYDDAAVQSMVINKQNGLEITVRCRQPGLTQKMSDLTRRDWWDQCRRLQAGALACVLDSQGMIQFFVVAETTLRVGPKNGQAIDADGGSQQKQKTLYVII